MGGPLFGVSSSFSLYRPRGINDKSRTTERVASPPITGVSRHAILIGVLCFPRPIDSTSFLSPVEMRDSVRLTGKALS